MIASARTICLCVCATALAAAAPARAEEAAARPPLPVEAVDVAHLETAVFEETFAGLIVARRTSALGFEAGGRVAEVNVDVGDRVEAGDPLAALDLRTLDAEIAASEAGVEEARASLVLARSTVSRQSDLIDRGHISQQSFDEAQAGVDAASARLLASQARLELLKARRELAVLSAPYAGVVTARRMDEGTVAAPGAPVLELVEAGVLEMNVGLPARRARTLVPGEAYRLIVDGRDVEATFRASTDVVDRATQTVAAVFDIPQTERQTERLAAGEVARLALSVEIDVDGFWAPLTALSEGRRGLWTVYVMAPDEGATDVFRAEPRVVEIVHAEVDRAYVRGSVADGETIIASGLDRVVPGQRVRPADPRRDIARGPAATD